MKLLLFLIILFQGAAFALTLEEAQKLAVKNSAHLKVLESEAAEAKAKKSSAEFMGLPKLGVVAGGEFEGNEDERDLLPLAYGYIGFTIYDGYQARIQRSLAQKEWERSELQTPYREFETKKEVEEIFLEVAYRDEKLKSLQKESLLFDRLKARATDRKRAGMIGDADIYEFELRKIVLATDLEALRTERKTFLRKLSLLTGVESEDLQGYALPEVQVSPLQSKPDQIISLEGKLIAKEQELLTLGKEASEAKWGPQVEFEARAGRLPSEGDLEKHRPRVDAMLVAKWDLFNRGQRTAASQEIIERQNTLISKFQEEQVKTRNLVEAAMLNFEYLRNKAALHKRKASPTNRYYKAMMDEYERGIKNSPDVAHAAELLFELEYQGLELRLDWARQKIELEKLSYQAM